MQGQAVTWAQFAAEPPSFIAGSKITGAKRQGLNYEKRAQLYIETYIARNSSLPGIEYVRSPWLCYKSLGNNGKLSYCQPDGIILQRDALRGVIVEIKLQHTSEAYFQTRHLYQPVLEKIFPEFTFSVLEVTKWLDPHIKFPEPFIHAESLLHFDAKFGVHIYDVRK